MTEQAHSSGEITKMGEKENIKAMLMQILNRMDKIDERMGEYFEQHRRETKRDMEQICGGMKQDLQDMGEIFRNKTKNDIKEDCQKVTEQTQSEII
jgi:ferritin-like metal-binding protein YciE